MNSAFERRVLRSIYQDSLVRPEPRQPGLRIENIDGVDYLVDPDGKKFAIKGVGSPTPQTHEFSDPEHDDHARGDDDHGHHRETPI